MKLTPKQKEMLVEMYNKREEENDNLVLHQIHFKQRSNISRVANNLKNKGLVEWVGTGLRFAVAYPTKEGMNIARELRWELK